MAGVRVMRWCLRGRSKSQLQVANGGKDVGVRGGEDERMGKYVSGKNKEELRWREQRKWRVCL